MRETLRSATLAGLAVLAVALAAATLDSTVAPRGPDRSGPVGPGGEGPGGLIPLPNTDPPIEGAAALPFPSELLAALGLVVLLLVLAYVLRYYRRSLAAVVVAAVLIGLSYLLLQSLFTLAAPPDPGVLEPGDGRIFGGAGGGGGGGGDATPPPVPSLALLFVLVLVLVLVGGLVAARGTATDDAEVVMDEGGSGPADVAAVGRVAGRAADRIGEETDVDNEVYRAWRELTELLDVDEPGTSTPGEFAAAATEAGLGREEVAELTRLFEDVRYGDRRPSVDRERRASAVFRRIESRYAGEDR